MSTFDPGIHAHPATEAARDHEDVLVEGEIVRHRLAARLVHWTVAATFLLCLVSGMPIWSPLFGWMAALLGDLSVCRIVHPWAGLAFFFSSTLMFFQWLERMFFEPHEWGWFGPRLIEYLRYRSDDSQVGKYNGGQKLLFWAVSLGALGLLLSGLVLWFPGAFPQWLRVTSILLHDAVFVLFVIAIVFHVYLGTAAEPGTFGAMTRGTVTPRWARLHHPHWYREVTGEGPERD